MKNMKNKKNCLYYRKTENKGIKKCEINNEMSFGSICDGKCGFFIDCNFETPINILIRRKSELEEYRDKNCTAYLKIQANKEISEIEKAINFLQN